MAWLRVGRESVFLDICSGIGPVVLQVATTTACAATGVEIGNDMHLAAQRLRRIFHTVSEENHVVDDEHSSSFLDKAILRKTDFNTKEGGDLIEKTSVIFFTTSANGFRTTYTIT